MKLSESTQKFLMRVGERSKNDFKCQGKPTPDWVYDTFKVLSMLEVCLGTAPVETIGKINNIADWKQQ